VRKGVLDEAEGVFVGEVDRQLETEGVNKFGEVGVELKNLFVAFHSIY
jgi:hypothetical protein